MPSAYTPERLSTCLCSRRVSACGRGSPSARDTRHDAQSALFPWRWSEVEWIKGPLFLLILWHAQRENESVLDGNETENVFWDSHEKGPPREHRGRRLCQVEQSKNDGWKQTGKLCSIKIDFIYIHVWYNPYWTQWSTEYRLISKNA